MLKLAKLVNVKGFFSTKFQKCELCGFCTPKSCTREKFFSFAASLKILMSHESQLTATSFNTKIDQVCVKADE